MKLTASLKTAFALVVGLAVLAVPTIALTQDATPEDKAIDNRRGFYQLVVWEFGPLAGMAKGEMEYDADAAQQHANNLQALTGYDISGLFLPGTSNEDKPGDTRALPVIWEKMDDFGSKYSDLQTAMNALADAAGQGQSALAEAVGAAGKACGACHDNFRAKDF